MVRIALLHPQCARLGGAIKMVLMTAHALQSEGHEVTLYTFERRDTCFPELQKGLTIVTIESPLSFFLGKPLQLGILVYKLRHIDMIIANNPPMQIVAALAKVFSLRFKRKNKKEKIKKDEYKSHKIYHFSLGFLHFELSSLTTIWWHHHAPWYYGSFKPIIFAKALFEKVFVIPYIDEMVSTSHYVADTLKAYCGRKSYVIHPVMSVYPQKVNHQKATNDQVTIFTHGRLEPGKGLDMLVRVFERMQNSKCKIQNEGFVSSSSVKRDHCDRRDERDPGIQVNQLSQSETKETKRNDNDLDSDFRRNDRVHLIIFGTGSLEGDLREKGIDVRPFDREKTFSELLSGENGHVVGVYCSEIDAFGMASLECQMMDIPTVILDRGGARETIVTNMSDEPVGYLVDSEETLFATVSYYIEHKMFPKQLSIVNFSHKRDHFTPERLSRDLLSMMSKIGA